MSDKNIYAYFTRKNVQSMKMLSIIAKAQLSISFMDTRSDL